MPVFLIIVGIIVLVFIAATFVENNCDIMAGVCLLCCVGIMIWLIVAACLTNRYELSYHDFKKFEVENSMNLISIINNKPINVCNVTDRFVEDPEKYYLERKRELNSGGVDWMMYDYKYRFVLKTECDGKTKIVEGD